MVTAQIRHGAPTVKAAHALDREPDDRITVGDVLGYLLGGCALVIARVPVRVLRGGVVMKPWVQNLILIAFALVMTAIAAAYMYWLGGAR